MKAATKHVIAFCLFSALLMAPALASAQFEFTVSAISPLPPPISPLPLPSGVGVAPQQFEFTVEAGNSAQSVVKLTNLGETALAYTLETEAFSPISPLPPLRWKQRLPTPSRRKQ